MRSRQSLLIAACVTALLVGAAAWLSEIPADRGGPDHRFAPEGPGASPSVSSESTGGSGAGPISASDRAAGATGAGRGAASAPGGSGGATSPMPGLAARPEVAAALDRADREAGRMVGDWIELASIPASSGREERRAEWVEEEMASAGLASIRRDGAGNVIGVLPGRDRAAKKVVFMAHMDTVAGIDADFNVRRAGGRLHGPGVRDDSSGLSAILTAARIAVEGGLTPPADLLFVASVREEVGLEGSKAFLDERGSEVGAFVAVDGYLGQISYAATSIVWMKMHFRAPGSHTLKSHEYPSTTLAAARAIEGIYRIETPRHPESKESWINVGMLGGGEVPNAQARDAWFTVDLRSNDTGTARRLETRILDTCREAARKVGVSFESETLQRMEGASIEGHVDSPIVRTSRDALEWLGWGDIRLSPRGTADHNIAILMGIPAVAIGVTTGEGAHTPTEYADIEPFTTGVKQILLLMAAELY